ncbi:MAG TPA: hypothetical protein VM238_22870 [Phycisphaerae bacterium]|nr:hypothetical protein [Phycisphaerae bacterium]
MISLSTIEFNLADGPPPGRRFWLVTGEGDGIGQWRHPALWRFLLEMSFAGGRESEAREHGVLATTRERALGCLVRDLKREERAEWVERVIVYRICPPLPPSVVREIESLNSRLQRQREARPATQASLAFA